MVKKMSKQAKAGSLGGKKTSETHSHEFYQTIGRKGGIAKGLRNKEVTV